MKNIFRSILTGVCISIITLTTVISVSAQIESTGSNLASGTESSDTAPSIEVDSILNAYLAEPRFSYGSILDSSENVAVPGVPSLIAPADGSAWVQSVSTTFNWSFVAGTGYDLQFDTATPIARDTNSFILTGGSLGLHTWKVRAKDATGAGNWSTTRSFYIVLPEPSLSAPANNATSASTTPTFSWSPVTGATFGYYLAVATSSTALPTFPTDSTCSGCISMVSASSTSSTLQVTLSAGSTYYWRVRGRGPGSTYGNWSNTFSFTTIAANHAPTLSLTSTSGTSVSAGQPYSIVVNAADVDGNLTNVDVNWNDGTAVEHHTVSGSSASTTFTRTFSTARTINWSANAYDATLLASNTLSGSFNVTASPVSGTLTLSASSCVIPAGSSTCNISVTWTTTNPVAVSGVRTDRPIANTVVSDGNNGGPLSTPVYYGNQTFYLYNNGIELASRGATSSCASGSTWNSSVGVCQANMSGTITQSPSCIIPAGSNTCSVNLTVTTTNPAATSQITSPFPVANTVVFTGNSGTVSAPVPYNSRNFYLYNNTFLLAQTTATSSCASGSTWNSSVGVCQAVMSGTITQFPSCIIPAGSNTCNVNLTISTTNPVGTSQITSRTPVANTVVFTGNNGTVSASVPYNSRDFYLYNSTLLLAQTTATSSCASGSTWNGSICQANKPTVFSITPSTLASAASDQDISVSGSNFKPNLTVSVTSPSGGITTVSGNQIQNVTENSFIIRTVVNVAGNWSIKVKNPDNQESAAFPITVASGGAAPFITSINPTSPVINGAVQPVIVTGGNFQNGLKVNITFPTGGVTTLQGTGQIQNVTANSFKLRITLNAEGAWKIRVLNPDNSQSTQFILNVIPSVTPPTGLPTSILSPVIGSLRITASNQQINDDKWEFNQHKTGLNQAGGGINLSNDTFAWDCNLYTLMNNNADKGESIYAVADGQVTSYVGEPLGNSYGAVLIAHPNAINPIWFSGYTHVQNIRITSGQMVTQSTVIGDIGRVGSDNEFLHFVIYSGQNTRGNLQSFNATITERGVGVSVVPEITSINANEPIVVSEQEQQLTIIGNNFQPGLTVQLTGPNGESVSATVVSNQSNAKQDFTNKVERVTSTSILVRAIINRVGPWFKRVTNPNGGRSSPFNFTVSSPGSQTAANPIIFIPGTMGSELYSPTGETLWPGDRFTHREQLNLDPCPTFPLPCPSNLPPSDIIVGDILRRALGSNIYDNFIKMLTRDFQGGFTEGDCNAQNGTISGNLFVFPYDWRLGNALNAEKLKTLVNCVNQLSGKKVDLIAHSQGGLVSRRYILNNQSDQKVRRLITLGTPWLGAPKFSYVLETGKGLAWYQHYAIISELEMKKLSWWFTGSHELAPSKAYFDLGGNPFEELDYDINGNHVSPETYTPNQYRDFLDNRYPVEPGTRRGASDVGTTGMTFHDVIGQDNWSNFTDNSGVEYFQIYGNTRSDNTIKSVIAYNGSKCAPNGVGGTNCHAVNTVMPDYGFGDETVPLVSSSRIGNSRNYNALQSTLTEVTYANTGNHLVTHGELVNNSGINAALVKCLLQPNTRVAAATCINNEIPQQPSAAISNVSSPSTSEDAYYLRVSGLPEVSISDSFENTSYPFSDSPDQQLRDVQTYVTGEKSFSTVFPIDQNYTIAFRSSNEPISIDLRKGNQDTTSLAIRFQDLVLPQNVEALLSRSLKSR